MQPLIAGIGQANVDFIGVVPRHPEPDGRTEMLEVSIQGGGAAATALAAARALGCRTRFAGKLADDDFGRFILRGLRDAGVSCDFVVTCPGHLSPFSFIAVGDDDGRRVCYDTLGDAEPLTADEVNLKAFLEGAAALFIDGHQPRAQIAAAEEARERDLPVFLDARWLREGMGEMVGLSDVLIAGERFVSEVAPRGEIEDSLVELLEMGPRTVIVTLGRAGCVALSGDKLVRREIYEVEAVDTTGAGDVFRGAVAAAMVQGYALEQCVELASAAAALKCRSLGARAGIADLDEVYAFLGWPKEKR